MSSRSSRGILAEGQLPNPERLLEEAVPTHMVHGLEVALAQTQLSDVGARQLYVGDTVAFRDVRKPATARIQVMGLVPQ